MSFKLKSLSITLLTISILIGLGPVGAQFPNQGGNQFPNQQGGNQFSNQGGNQFPNQGGNQFPNQGGNQFPNQGGKQFPNQQGASFPDLKNEHEVPTEDHKKLSKAERKKLKENRPLNAECICPMPKNSAKYTETPMYFCADKLNSPKCQKDVLYECNAPLAPPIFSKQCDKCIFKILKEGETAKCKIGGATVSYDRPVTK